MNVIIIGINDRHGWRRRGARVRATEQISPPGTKPSKGMGEGKKWMMEWCPLSRKYCFDIGSIFYEASFRTAYTSLILRDNLIIAFVKWIIDIMMIRSGFSFSQIGSLKGYYLFHHRHVSKRSLDSSPVHHEALNSEDEVRLTPLPVYTPLNYPLENETQFD